MAEECYVEQNGVPHYYNDNRNVLVIIVLPDRLLDVDLRGAGWNTMYPEKGLRHKIEISYATIPPQTIQKVHNFVACCHQFSDAGGGHFKRLRHNGKHPSS